MTLAAVERPPGGPAFSRAECGGLKTRLNGTRAILRPSGALWLPSSQTLCAADLHFEKGSSYARRGQMLPPYDTHETLMRLEDEVARLDPSVIVLMGDSFHDGEAEGRMDPGAAQRIAALASGRTFVWIVGNHDEDGPRALPGEIAHAVGIESLVLTHEPLPGRKPGEVAGHLHPCARVSAFGRTVRSRCFATDGERLVMPAFGAFTGGLDVRDRAFAGLFGRPPVPCALGRNRVHALDWRALI